MNRSGCMDLCEQGANVMVYPGERWYSRVTVESAEQIIQEHLAPLVTGCHSRESENLIPACAGMTTQDEIASRSRNGGIRAFLFDLGNVLVRFDHRAAAQGAGRIYAIGGIFTGCCVSGLNPPGLR